MYVNYSSVCLLFKFYVNYSSFADLPFVGWGSAGYLALSFPLVGNQSAKCISPSPTGEARWGLMTVFFSLIMTSYSSNEHQPPLVLKPILTFPKGRDRLLCQ